MPNRTISVRQADARLYELASAIADELRAESLSSILAKGLRRQVAYLETYYPDAVARARQKTGVTT